MKTFILLRNTLFVTAYMLVGMLFFTNTAFAQKEAEKARTYLQANAATHHLSADDIQRMTVSSQYLSPTTGWYHIYYNQVYQSIDVYNGILNVTLVKDKVEYVGNNFVENIADKVPSGINGFQQSPLSAINKAASYLSLNYNAVDTKQETVIRLANGQVSKAVYTNTALSNEAIPVKLYWYPHTDSTSGATSLHLVWSVEIYTKDRKNYWVTQVDASSGEVVSVDDQVIKCNFGTHEHGHQHNHLQNIHSDTPAQTRSRLTPLAANSYNVFDYPIESPNHGSRTIVTNPYTKFAPSGNWPGATNGWHDDGTTAYTTTRGNNVLAKEDVNADNEYSIGASPTSATLDFDHPFTHGLNTAAGNRNAAITNLFYWNNLIHDVLWKYGFDEPSGNFQKDNMGRGGLGGDYVLADAQDGLGTDNANFFTNVDGHLARMQMYLWSPSSIYQPDSDFDNGIIGHEYGHGWSIRLTGGPATVSCLNNLEQGGEGWSDYLALMITTPWSTLTPAIASANIAKGIGTYSVVQPTTGQGIRPYRYSYDMANINSPVTYARVATWVVPHHTGSVWATMLWDMTWEIIFQDNQIVNDIYNTSTMVGNVAALKLVNEGLRLQKCNPSFIDARNAILKADSLLFNSRYSCAIWKAFARRGLGVNASSGNSSNDRIVIEDFTPMTNRGRILTSPKQVMVCSHSVFNYTATFTGAGTLTVNWARAAVAGISNAGGSGKTATINETLINTTNSPITVTYKLYLSPSSCQIPLELKVVVNPAPLTSIASYEVCKDGTVPVGQGLMATDIAYTNSVTGAVVAGATYWRGRGDNVSSYTAVSNGIGNSVYYQTYTFVPATSGVVSVEVAAAAFNLGFPYDTYLSLYQTSFNPASPATNFVAGDDDSGTLQYSSKITYNFTAGTTYILVIAPYYNGSVGTYQLQATANIFGATNSWYAASSGGSPLATGNLFNPVGVAGSGIIDTATPLTQTFYLGSATFACRATATFTVNSPSEGGSIAGSTTACADLNKGKLTLSGYSSTIVRWESSSNNFTDVTQLADTATTIIYTNLTQTTQYRAVVKNGACPTVNSAIATITRTSPTLPTIDNYAVCQNSALIFGVGFTAPFNSYNNKVSGTLSNDSHIYRRGDGNNMTTYIGVGLGGESVFYRPHVFVAPANQTVTIETSGGTLNGQSSYDTYLTLYRTSFNPASPATNFLVGDNDSGALLYGSKITYTFTAGTTYILVVATKENGVTGNYEVQATANIFSGNAINWYDYSTGGNSLATSNIFNPIAVVGTGVPNTSSAISKTFFVDTPDSPSCRVPVIFNIHQTPVGGNVVGSATVCSNSNSGTLALDGYVGTIAKWQSSTNNFATITDIANTTNTLNYTDVAQTTQFRALIQSGVCVAVASQKALVVRTNSPATATGYNICKDATIPVGQGLVNANSGYTNSVSGEFVVGSPTYARSWGNDLREYKPIGRGFDSVYYQIHTFTPTTTGPVSIEVVAANLTTWTYDTYMALYQNSFEPGSPAINFVTGNDTGGALPYSSKITETLIAGTTYVIVISPYINKVVGTYEIEATANIFGNPNNWYGNSLGGEVLGTGNIFNPVGVAGSGISNTATPIAKTFYAGYPALGSCLSPATFTVNSIDSLVLSGSARCSPGSSILTATGCTGGTVNWYTSISGGTAVATGASFTTPSLSTTNTYYASCTVGACVSDRTPAVVVIGTTDATYSTNQNTGDYHVSQTISSSANVSTGVNYFAGKAIMLTPGFQAGGDEVFLAKIQDCP